MRTRDVSIPFRVTEKELQEIDKRAEKAKLDRTNYLITCALNKKITVLEDLKPLLDDTIAGIMMTNPNTLGLFEKDIKEIDFMKSF